MSTKILSARPAPFLPALEGLRAIACSGIIITHVAFQTGADTGNLLNRMMARTDFFVPVFFALSGFLLWQAAYSEIWFTEAYWPAFRRVDFLRALREYSARNRRFGQ